MIGSCTQIGRVDGKWPKRDVDRTRELARNNDMTRETGSCWPESLQGNSMRQGNRPMAMVAVSEAETEVAENIELARYRDVARNGKTALDKKVNMD